MEICMVLIFACVLICVKSQDDITVNTQLGTIKGARRRELLPNLNMTVYEFRKIPFARPPEGDLRFEKPVPYGSWNGILDATQYSPSCYQTLGELEAFLQNKNISEDCLYLNIYVPYSVSSSNNKSVMVWIHGGGYSTGQASLYDGAYLAFWGDVIVVTVNYRLNVFGFFSYGDIKGNFGLWDQKLAIQWVNDNIQSFGGNKQSITIFGESSGGFSVGLHSIIPSNRGLFQRAILQSGTAMSTYTTGIITKDASKKVAYSLNCSQTDSYLLKQCLKNVPVDVLFKASQKKDFIYSTLLIPFAPVIDGDLLTDNPKDILLNTTSAGHMNVTDLPQWKEYDTTNEHYLNFDLNITPGQHLYKDRVDFWLNYIPGILKGETMKSACSSIQQTLWTACIFVAFNILGV